MLANGLLSQTTSDRLFNSLIKQGPITTKLFSFAFENILSNLSPPYPEPLGFWTLSIIQNSKVKWLGEPFLRDPPE
jgi:hypothetical protein